MLQTDLPSFLYLQECSNLFSSGGGESLAQETGVPFLGRVPLDPRLAQSLEEGRSLRDVCPGTPTQIAVDSIIQTLLLPTNSSKDGAARLSDDVESSVSTGGGNT